MRTLLIAAVLCVASQTNAADIYTQNRTWGGTYIFIVGKIFPGDEHKFAALHPTPPVFVRPIGSGGYTTPALDIADMIWARGYKTLVENRDGGCASACVIIWLSGRQVFVQNSGILQFHSCWNSETQQDDMECNAEVAKHLMVYGYTKYQAWSLATATPHETFRLGTKQWARELGFTWQTLNYYFGGANACTVRFCLR
jgi:hypothetical protein